MKTSPTTFYRTNFFGPFAAILLAASQIQGQVKQDLPAPPPLPNGIYDITPEIHKATPSPEEKKKIESEIQEIFYQIFEKKLDGKILYDLYKALERKVDSVRGRIDPQTYLPDFSEEFNKKQCISVTDFKSELNKVTTKLSNKANLETTLEAIDSYRELCNKDLNRRFRELCLQIPFDAYSDDFRIAHEAFQKKISEAIITEFDSLQNYQKLDTQYLKKIRKLSNHLAELHSVGHEHVTSTLFNYLSSSQKIIDFSKKYRVLNSFPEVNVFFKEKILPKFSDAKAVLDGNKAELEKSTQYIGSIILRLNSILNSSNSSESKDLFFKDLNSEIVNFHIKTILTNDEKTQKDSLENLKKQLDCLIDELSSRAELNQVEIPIELYSLLKLNPKTEQKEIYYQLLTLASKSPEIKIDPSLLRQAQNDLTEVIQGNADTKTKLQLKNFLANFLVADLKANNFDQKFQSYLSQAKINFHKNTQTYIPNFSNTSTVLLDLLETVGNPSLLTDLPRHSNPVIASNFKIPKNEKPNIKHLQAFNQRYINSWKFFEGVVFTAQQLSKQGEKLDPYRRRDGTKLAEQLSKNLASLRHEIYSKFSLEERPHAEFHQIADAYIHGISFGNFLENQAYLPLSPTSQDEEFDDDCMPHSPNFVSNKINFYRNTSAKKYRTEDEPYTFPPIIELRSRLPLEFSGKAPSTLDTQLTKGDQAFILGAVSVLPDFNTAQINLTKRLQDRYAQVIKIKYPYTSHILLGESFRDFFVNSAIQSIKKENPDIPLELYGSSVEKIK